eukprot:scaffold15316_cov69-Phaeocystis_antarctica.AAC.3
MSEPPARRRPALRRSGRRAACTAAPPRAGTSRRPASRSAAHADSSPSARVRSRAPCACGRAEAWPETGAIGPASAAQLADWPRGSLGIGAAA